MPSPTLAEPEDVRAVRDWLKGRARILVLTHERPDGDAYGALCGALLALREAGKECLGYLKLPLPQRYARVLPPVPELILGTPLPRTGLDGIVCLDVTGLERVERPAGIDANFNGLPLCVIDHHADHTRFGQTEWVDARQAATCQMLLHLLRDARGRVSPPVAACLLTGLLMDTGGFRFANAGAGVLRDAAALVDAGADLHGLMTSLFLRESLGRRRLEARLLAQAVSLHGGRGLYSVLTPHLLAEFGVPPQDTEGLIDVLRGIEGVDIACLVQPEPGAVRLSLRSQNSACPVNGIARQLGGGGHVLAAGARLPDVNVAQAVTALTEETRKVLGREAVGG